jgi:biopolymer transport protein ExbD
MADVTLSSHSGKRSKPLPRVDLTPMVDLGFILITFFMYTTTLLESKSMDINMPLPSRELQEIPMESTISLLLTENHQLCWYSGVAETEKDLKKGAVPALRGIIQLKQSEVRKLPAGFSKEAHKLHVIIKSADDSKYEDLVNVLDEMLICQVPYYVLQDMSPQEKAWLQERKRKSE